MRVMKRPSGGSPSSTRRAITRVKKNRTAMTTKTSPANIHNRSLMLFRFPVSGSTLAGKAGQQAPVIDRQQALQPGEDQRIIADDDPCPVPLDTPENDIRGPGRRHAQQLRGALEAGRPLGVLRARGRPGAAGNGRG